MSDDSSGYAERTGVDASTIDVEAAGREAVDKTLRSRLKAGSPVVRTAAPPAPRTTHATAAVLTLHRIAWSLAESALAGCVATSLKVIPL